MLQLNEREWAEFDIRAVFPEIKRGKRLKTADHIVGNVPYVSSSAMNNGVDAFIGNDGHIRKYENCITLANSGSVGTSFYHCYEFIASDHVTALQSRKLNKYSYLFIATMVSRLQEKYSFNREINDLRINREKVLLPIDDDGQPDYAFMEQYIQEREKQLITQYLEHIGVVTYTGGVDRIMPLHEKDWKEFKITDFFIIAKGNQNNMAELQAGNIPLISAKKVDNGCKGFYASNSKSVFNGNCLTINNDGDGGAGISYYQPCNMLLDTHVTALYPRIEMSESVMHFISACITVQREKFGHGYSLNNARLSVFRMMLPVASNGQPDWQYMEQYINMLITKIKLQYLQSKQIQ